MLNTNKEDNLKGKATHLAETTKKTIDETVTEGKREAQGVVNSLKKLLAQYSSSPNVQELKEQILDKAHELKGTVSDEVAHAYHVGKDRTVHTVQEKPLLSLGLAIGAGLLLGYILGTKSSSK